MKQKELAEKMYVSEAYLSLILSGEKTSVKARKKIILILEEEEKNKR